MPPASHVMDSGTGPDHHGSHPQLDVAATYQPVYSHSQLSSAGVMSHQQLGYSLMEQQQQLDLTQERMLMQVFFCALIKKFRGVGEGDIDFHPFTVTKNCNVLQEEMLRSYLATAESDLRAKQELVEVKQQRLSLAQNDLNHLKSTLSILSGGPLSESTTSRKY